MVVYPDKFEQYVTQNLCDENDVDYEMSNENRERLKAYINWLGVMIFAQSAALGKAFNDKQGFVNAFANDKEKKRWTKRGIDWQFERLYKKVWLEYDYNWYLWGFWMSVLNNVAKFKYAIYTDSSNIVFENKIVKPLYKEYRKKTRMTTH